MHHYMAELIVRGELVWVVGGGTVATRKIGGLLETGANIVVMAPEFSKRIVQWEEEGRLHTRRGVFQERDLDKNPVPLLVFAATGSPQLNREIAGFCRERKILCNSADDSQASGFLVPATVRRGPLTVAVATQGASPALSRLIKERIDRWLEPGWGGVVEVFGAMRAEVIRRLPDVAQRQNFWRKTALLVEEEGHYTCPDPEMWFLEKLDEVSPGTLPGDHPSFPNSAR